MKRLTVAVVVPTRDRAAMLDRTLQALAAQARPPDEIIVVDDASTDTTAEVLAAHGVPHLVGEGRGPARARNLGIARATSDVVAFTDDDCIPATTWLEHLVEPLASDAADFVQGRTLPDPDGDLDAGPWSHTMRVEQHTQNYPTCNMAYRRSLLESLGGFDESFPYAASEDTDLAWRALESGARVVFVEDALVHHAIWPSSFADHLRRMVRWESIPRLIARHPSARSLLHSKYVWRRSHVRVLRLGTAAIVLAAIHPAGPLVASGVFAGRQAWVAHREDRDVGRGVAEAFLRLAADSWEVVILAAGSVRHRTLVL